MMNKGRLDDRSRCSQTGSIHMMYLSKDACTFHKNRRGSQFRMIIVCTDCIWLALVFNNETGV